MKESNSVLNVSLAFSLNQCHNTSRDRALLVKGVLGLAVI